ncbi:MAG TPA: sigma-70 family RNA polymerase sigma factor [Gemmataceae bacterium]
MASTPLGSVVRHIHKLAGAPSAARTTDLHLLRCFADKQDEEAFGELLRRHGPLVLGVCRRVLGHEQDAEDAFQAAFLVLARKAASVRKGESVGSFLYGVAYRIAMRERTRIASRRNRERRAESRTPTGPVYEAAWRELQVVLDEGLNRLAEKYRAPFVLCCLEGKSKSDAATELGWKEGTVSSRLAQARKELQTLLSRKGVTLAAALAALGLAENAASAKVPALLASLSLRTATLFAAGASVAEVETMKAVQLAEAALKSIAALPWKTATTLLLTACLVVSGAGLAHPPEEKKPSAANEPPAAKASGARKQPKAEEKPRTDRYGDPLPPGALARLGTTRFRQGFLTYSVLFSPDGKTIACAAAGRGLCLWDVATGKELRQIGEVTHARSIAFSPDGKVLACVFSNGVTALYETATGQKIADLPRNAVTGSLVFAPDGKILAGTIGPGSAIHFFDAATGEKLKQEVSAGQDGINRLAWSPHGKKLAWVGTNGPIHLCNTDNGEEIDHWEGHDKAVSGVAFSPDGKTLATGSQDQTIRLWNVATRKENCTLDGKHQQVRVVVFSRNGRMLASGHDDGTIALWDLKKGEEIRRWQAHAFMVSSLDFSPDDKTLVSGAFWECGPRLWDVATGEEVRSFVGHTSSVDRVMFSEDGKHIRSLGRDKKVLDWDLASGKEKVRFRLPFHAAPRALDHYALSPRGDLAASWGYKDDKVRLWDVATGKERRTLGTFDYRNKEGFLEAMEFSLDGRLLAFTGTEDKAVSVWDVETGTERQHLKGLPGKTLGIVFSRDGKKIAAVSLATIGIWDVTTGKRLARFSSSSGHVHALAFSPDGKMLASSWLTTRGATELWDATTGQKLRTLTGAPPLYALTFSPDGKWLAGAGADEDQKVHVWEVNSGLEVRCFASHTGGGVLSLAFAPDGRTLASGGGDSSVLLWDVTGRMSKGRWQATTWTKEELEQRWKDLASTDGKRVAQAIWDLAASPEQSVSLFRSRIKPPQPVDTQHVERLIHDLDSEELEIRRKAAGELEKIVEGAEPLLRKKLAEKPSLEQRQRIMQVLESASAERLRVSRAIQVLEYAGTAEAKECLRSLAKDLVAEPLKREAKAALERLAK